MKKSIQKLRNNWGILLKKSRLIRQWNRKKLLWLTFKTIDIKIDYLTFKSIDWNSNGNLKFEIKMSRISCLWGNWILCDLIGHGMTWDDMGWRSWRGMTRDDKDDTHQHKWRIETRRALLRERFLKAPRDAIPLSSLLAIPRRMSSLVGCHPSSDVIPPGQQPRFGTARPHSLRRDFH